MNDTYTFMRHFADSWALLALFTFFAGTILFVFRPGSGRLHREAARSILKDDDTLRAPSDPRSTEEDAR